MKEYAFKRASENMDVFTFDGPGLSPFVGGVSLSVDEQCAETVARLLARAYEAGRWSARREIRHALGILGQ